MRGGLANYYGERGWPAKDFWRVTEAAVRQRTLAEVGEHTLTDEGVP